MENFVSDETILHEIELMELKAKIENGALVRALDLDYEFDLREEWYEYIHHYEEACEEEGYTTVYDLIKPTYFPPVNDLTSEEIELKLPELTALLFEHNIHFAYPEEYYSSATIYKFITETFFHEKICRYMGPGGTGYRIYKYEYYCPDHAHILSDLAEEVITKITKAEWNPDFLPYTHHTTVDLNNQKMSLKDYEQKIVKFRTQFPEFLFQKARGEDPVINMEVTKAMITGEIFMKKSIFPFTLHFQLGHTWLVSGLNLELLG
jgi:hypothetical protein